MRARNTTRRISVQLSAKDTSDNDMDYLQVIHANMTKQWSDDADNYSFFPNFHTSPQGEINFSDGTAPLLL